MRNLRIKQNPSNREPVFIIAEAGSNWKVGSAKADLKRACALIDVAKAAGADAVKFQTFNADSVYVPNAGSSGYLAKRGIKDSISALFRRLSIPCQMIPKLAKYCQKRKIEFMSSFFSPDDFETVDPWVKRHKIASYEITYPKLLELAARSKKPLILSTGASTSADIVWAINYFRKHRGRQLTLMQCTARYPASLDALNLKTIPEIIRQYKICAGFSDHSMDPLIGPVAAVALGARVIEKHFTLSRKLYGPDHAFAIEPKELKEMVQAIRGCELALGNEKKRVLPEETELYFYAQRAVQATCCIKKSEVLREGVNMAVLRPGRRKKGMHPRWMTAAEGKRAKKLIYLGDGIQKTDF